MNATATLHVRRAGRDDVPELTDWTSDDPVVRIGADRLTAELATENYRPEWSWVAEQAGRHVTVGPPSTV
ncbi:hypothetical protein J2Y89_000513 [Curtobacterium herbarum]|uniref:hypothetical protein n=1 Tax=Curtobacterium herbarum TaxID=150122 RepID=UPI0020A07B2A|nr:hypothetical protein [Curtobacterium herbarum]MCP1501769.1 hypothetical protein [Curtobacterium herbarum]